MKYVIPIAAALLALSLSACDVSTNHSVETIVPAGWESTYETYHYAPAVRAGDMLILSGVVAATQDGFSEEQIYTEAFKTIGRILTEGGATWGDVVEFQTFHTDLPAQINTFAAVKDQFVKEPYPAWTAIDIDRLYTDNGIVEIKVTAYLGDK